jgi:hypothetical protein
MSRNPVDYLHGTVGCRVRMHSKKLPEWLVE